MPKKTKRQTAKQRALTNAERDHRVEELEFEQEKKLRQNLGSGLSLKRALSNTERDRRIAKKEFEQEKKLRRELQDI